MHGAFVLSGRGMLLTVSRRPARRGEHSPPVDPEKCTASRTQSTTSNECSSNNKVVVVGTSRSNRPINRPCGESATGLRPRTDSHLCTRTRTNCTHTLQKARECSLPLLLGCVYTYILGHVIYYYERARESHTCVCPGKLIYSFTYA